MTRSRHLPIRMIYLQHFFFLATGAKVFAVVRSWRETSQRRIFASLSFSLLSHTCTKIRSSEWNDFLGPAKYVQGHQEKINKIIKTFMNTMKREVFHLFHFKWEKSRFVWIDIICRWNIERKYRYNHIVKYCIKNREKKRNMHILKCFEMPKITNQCFKHNALKSKCEFKIEMKSKHSFNELLPI